MWDNALHPFGLTGKAAAALASVVVRHLGDELVYSNSLNLVVTI